MAVALILALAASPMAEPPARPDWAVLPPLPLAEPPQMTPEMTGFVAREVGEGRCPVPAGADGHHHVQVDVAVLLAADGTIRATLPHAIGCPTVEQFSAGLASTVARGVIATRIAAERWYRLTLSFDWS